MLLLKFNNSKPGIYKLLIKQKSLIRKSRYFLFHEEKIIFQVTQQLYNFINLITGMDLCDLENLKRRLILFYVLLFLLNPVNFMCPRIHKFMSIYNMVYFILFVWTY